MDSSIVSGPFCKVTPEQFNINSFTAIKDFLLSKGWKPDSFTEKGSPQLTESSFHTVTGEVPQLITKRSVLKHRIRMLRNVTKDGSEKGLVHLVRSDGRITAGGVPQGTPTGRWRHTNVVNVPKAHDPDVLYGTEIRSLFVAKPGYVLVGCDAKGIESRVEAHYCYDKTGGVEYAKELLEGDIHQKNADILGVSRKVAKGFKYAISYGAQPQKITEVVGCSTNRARRLYNTFWNNTPSLAELRDELAKVWNSRGGKNGGFIKGLDGRKLYGRSEHSLVNLLFQSAAAIIFKTATCYVTKWIEQEGLDARQVISMHDEYMFESHPDCADRVMELAALAFEKAGEFHKTNVKFEGDAKKGDSWASVH